MELGAVQDLLDVQDGVVSRRQLLERGATDADIRRWLRRKDLARVHPGVFVNHTGTLSWASRSWAAVLYFWPAALARDSVVNRAGDVIHVAVDASRRVSRLPGVQVHRLVGFDERVQWNTSPPRVRLEDALLSWAAEASTRSAALVVLSDACRRRITTPARLAAHLAVSPSLLHRGWLLSVLEEAAAGVQSLLESSYLRNVERAHGLPRADRQRHERTLDGVVYRDARYQRYGLDVELDGRIGHELSNEKWDDQDRDLLSATEDRLTLRLGWRHCEDTACRTATRLARVFQQRGWTGTARRCRRCPTPGDSQSPGD
jgi:hypothetical protein